MSRIGRIVVQLTTIAAVLAIALVLMPTGAIGGERTAPPPTQGDRFVFGRDAEITAPVGGSVQVYGGSAHVQHAIRGDLVVFGGDVVFTGQGAVTGNVIYAGGRVLGAEGRVLGHVYPLMTLQGAAATMSKNAVVMSLLLVWFVVAIAVTLLGGREVRVASTEIRISALYTFTLGLVAFTSFVLTAIVFSYLVPYLVGIPLLAALAVFAILTKVFGMVAVFHTVGTLVAGVRTRQQLAERSWLRGDLAMVVVGALLLGMVRLIPVVGTIVWSCASIFGVGVALGTRFGRREPDFLAWRPAEA